MGGRGDYIYLSLHCHHKNDFCIKVGSDESHFNLSVGSDGQSHKTVSTNHNLFEEKGEPKQYQTEVLPSAYQPNALPLGQTGSQVLVEHGIVLYCDAKVLRGSDILQHLVVQLILVTTDNLFAAHGQDTALHGVETHVRRISTPSLQSSVCSAISSCLMVNAPSSVKHHYSGTIYPTFFDTLFFFFSIASFKSAL